jgi:hypothetical protein
MLRFLLILALAASAYGQPARGWVILGRTHVDGKVDHDRIMVNGRPDEFRSSRMLVQNNGIRFDRVLVHFRDGSSLPLPVRAHVSPGSQTPIFDVPPRRAVDFVEFWYDRGNWRNPRRPRLTLYGHR